MSVFYLENLSFIVLVCHNWTDEDNKAMPQGRTPEDERQYCEDILGYTFTQGQNEEYPKCGECWCCKPERYFLFFDHLCIILSIYYPIKDINEHFSIVPHVAFYFFL
jgi:hypothetical protein